MMQVVNSDDVKRFLLFEKIWGKILLSGDKMMFLQVEIEPGGVVQEHTHPHEQMGVCLEGRVEFKSGDVVKVVEPGMVYWFKSNEKHSAKVLGDKRGLLLEVFSPPREDYLKKIKSQ